MKNRQRLIFDLLHPGLLALVVGIGACQPSPQNNIEKPARAVAVTFAGALAKLGDYWYQGKAEISSYTVQQNRYRDLHPGEVVLVFVTEDFLTGKQVKNERYQSDPSTKVLKLNKIHRFVTGLYDYSVMTSVFTPVAVQEFPYTLKVTNSSQDWCGQTFQQVNFRDDHYQSRLFSYFEQEGDQQEELPLAVLEDELFNRIRINPESLPVGAVSILPATMYCRLMHVPFAPQSAKASREAYAGNQFSGKDLQAYRVEYPDLQRTLEIVFEGAAPFRIAGWTDTYPSLLDGQVRTTLARRKQTLLDAYWRHNGRQDHERREELELDH